MHSRILFAGIFTAAVALTGCTSSTGDRVAGTVPTQSAGSSSLPTSATPSLSQRVDFSVSGPGADPALIEAFAQAQPDAEINGEVVPEGGDVELGLFAGVPYGTDVICVVVNRSWFAANLIDVPQSAKQAAPWLIVDHPAESPQIALWLAGRASGDEQKIMKNLQRYAKWGAHVSWLPKATSAEMEERSIIASALYPWEQANNLGTDSQWETLPNTCVSTRVHAASTTQSGDAFVEFLTSPAGQQELADLGITYPLDEGNLPTQVQNLAPEPAEAMEIPAADASAWLEAVGRAVTEAEQPQSR